MRERLWFTHNLKWSRLKCSAKKTGWRFFHKEAVHRKICLSGTVFLYLEHGGNECFNSIEGLWHHWDANVWTDRNEDCSSSEHLSVVDRFAVLNLWEKGCRVKNKSSLTRPQKQFWNPSRLKMENWAGLAQA